MDPISITPLVISAWTLIAPYAKKLADKLVEKAEESLPAAVGAVWDMVKEKMEARPETSTLPTELATTPDDQVVQGAFQYQLKKLLESDATFAQQLENLINQAIKVDTSHTATLNGDGTIAQGFGATAVGKGGVHIGGNASGNMIITGDKNKVNSEKRNKK